MNDQFIDELLDDDIPMPNSSAKRAAVSAALDEFSQKVNQENVAPARPMNNEDTQSSIQTLIYSVGSNIMTVFKNLNSKPVFATVAVGLLSFAVVSQLPVEELANKEPASARINPETLSPSGTRTESSSSEDFGDTKTERIDSVISVVPAETATTAREENKPIGSDTGLVEQVPTQSDSTESTLVRQQAAPVSVAEARKTSPEQKVKKEVEAKKTSENNAVYGQPYAQTYSRKTSPEQKAKKEVEARANTKKVESLRVKNIKNRPTAIGSSSLDLEEAVIAERASSNDEFQSQAAPLAKYSTSKISASAPSQSVVQPIGRLIAIPEPTGKPVSRPDLGEEYPEHSENRLTLVSEQPVSTFSADVDTASYSLLRNQLQRGFLPSPNAVRSEELINYFSYNYPYPTSKKTPFKASVSVLDSPWNSAKKLVHVGIKGYDIKAKNTPDSNLVFLLDVSGSMSSANKLPLVKQSIGLLLKKLKPTDTVSIVVYAGAAGVVLEPTEAKNRSAILAALEKLNAGGSTAGGAGIELAYSLAEQNYKKGAVNRIILATDGDFNVGQSSNESLKTLVERKRKNGVFLSVLGFGRNNYQDDMMQALAQNGNGVAAYIDSLSEAKKVLVDQANSTLFTIAKDVKLQVEFNPTTVSDYRLVGYETRHLNREDFNNDKVDAGDIGSGHTVTAIYEITPTSADAPSVDALRYSNNKPTPPSSSRGSENEYGFLKIRYKLPNESKSKLIETPIRVAQSKLNENNKVSQDIQFSIAVAGFAQYLKGGKYISDTDLEGILKLARQNKGSDDYGYRSEFIRLVEMAEIAKP